MKVKRKYYPKSTDKEFILCSFNDIKFFTLDMFYAMKNLETPKVDEEGNVTTSVTFRYTDFIEKNLNETLKKLGLKPTKRQMKLAEKYF